MDLLSNGQARRAILDFYQASGEPQAVQEAIKVSERQAMSTFTVERMKREKTRYVNTPPSSPRRNISIKSPKETNPGMAPAIFDPYKTK